MFFWISLKLASIDLYGIISFLETTKSEYGKLKNCSKQYFEEGMKEGRDSDSETNWPESLVSWQFHNTLVRWKENTGPHPKDYFEN